TRRSPTVRLAGRSASTAGGRTASTTGALLIGITLVTAVVVGSASLQRTLELATAEDTPVDLVVTASGSDVDSVLDDSPVVDDRVEVPSAAASVSVEGGQGENDLTIASAAEAGDSSVVRSDGYDVERGTVLVDPDELGLDGVTSDIDGKTVTVAVGGETLTLEAVGSRDVPAGTALVSAFVGVSTTLTQSVIDRRREGALLRALGFTRGSMSRMITIESLLMTVIALVVGAGVGTFFGWVGTASITPDVTEPVLSVPPVQLGLIGLAAVLAAVLASAIPARTMSRIAPAKGMSME